MVKHNQGSHFSQQNSGQTNHFRCNVAQDRHNGFPFEYGQLQHGLPEEPLTQQELLSLIEKKMTISGRWVVTAISGGKTSWLSPKSERYSQSLELSNRSFNLNKMLKKTEDGVCGGCWNTNESSDE